MKNVKRISSIVLIVCMLLTVLPSEYLFIRKNESEAYAADSYNSEAALQYAREHWNDGVGLCAEFVSRCAQAAGVNMGVYGYTIDAFNAISERTGVASQDLTLDSDGYARIGNNANKLAAGDVVIQWCYTDGLRPHILLCGGYDSDGIATFYAHNSALNNKRYKLNSNSQHASSHNIGAKVLHFGNNDTTPPTIKNVSVTISHDYADINCEVYDNVGVAKVQFPTWPVYKTSAGCTWYNPTNSTGNSYWFRMNLSDFNNYRGEYLTHIYAWDAAGNCTSASTGNYDMTENNTPPVISNVRVTNITNYGYTVECDVSDDNGLRNIQFPTWTKAGGQDDLIWHNGTINGNHAYFNVRIADHNNEYGEYTTHIYVWDVSGNCSTVRGESEPYILRGYEPKKIEEFNGHIYAAFDVEEKWTDAKKICEDMGGHLATVTSQEEEDLIKDLCGGRIAAYFLGATDDGSEGSWHWITGEDFSYTDWEDNQPDNANGTENYLELISRSSKWNDIDGYMSRGFVFEMDDDLTPVATITYNNSIYELYNTNTSFPVAQKYCEMHGGNLVCITTAEENEAVKGLINKGSKQCYLMGGSDKEVEGTWKNVTGEPFVYSNWMEGEPNNCFGSENFMYMHKDGSWNDAPATYDNGFILEKEITHVDNITLDKNEIILEEGAADKLSAIFEPTVATNKNISWTVDDNTVATVDCNGNITAVTAGETDITATTNDGGLTAKCHVVVNPKENPVISNVVIKNKKLSGYTIECDVADNTEVKDIYLDTWTTKAVKDDEKDELSSIKGIVEDGHVVFDVDINTHKKEAGEYKNVIRAYDVFSNETQLETENVFIKNGYEPEVVFENDGHIYAIFDIADNYITANDKCIEMEGHLASIDSIDEKLAILNIITAENKKFFILSGNNEKASYIDENGKVFETGLNENVDGFIYELDKNLEPENSVVSGNKKYVAYSTCLPWEVAKVYCETHGGYLACINSEEESDTVNGLVSELGNFRYFLGATDKENEGEWKWLTNEEFLNDYWELFSIYKPSNSSGYGKSEKDADYICQYGYENYLVIDTEEYRKINNSKISPFWNDVKSQLVSTGFILEKDIQRDSVNAEFDAWPEGHEGESDITGVSVTATYNDPLVLKVVAQGDGLSYVWKKNNVGIKGANEDRYEVPNVTYSATFTCTVSDVYGNTKDIEFFVAVDNELKAYVKGTTDNAATLDLKKGEEATLAVDVSALDTEGITYEWRGIYKNSSGEVYTKRVGTGDEYTFVFGEEDHDYYRYTCGVSDRFGNTCYVEFDVNDALVNTSFISQYAVVGQKIVFKGSATGGSGNYQYAYYYRKTTDSAWTTAGTEWGTSAYATAKPGSNTVYEVCIKVRDANNTSNVVKKYLSFAANTTETSLKCYGSVYKTIYKYGTTNKITASSANASGTVKYKYEYRKASSWTYETIQDYTTSTKVSWNAPQTGSFTLRITAYDGTDYAIRTINIKVKK